VQSVGLKLTTGKCFAAGLDHELMGYTTEVEAKDTQATSRNHRGNGGADQSTSTSGSDKKQQKAKARQVLSEVAATPQSLPNGSLLYQNHRMFRSEAPWAGFDIDREPQVHQPTPFFGLAHSGVIYCGTYSL